ncbi:HPr kinase/phosphorylase [Hydrogenovibrio crunogenus]|uniref:HPr kinase/phosphorylase n=1 Tax=Hydrogenovibrio crunogenus TaxID=39765 RepID=A0A4P7P179_9GAMM|nr:HprK-related kinase B [Hydrogenovibrio crunogenus]QBZ83798.1 HPr kinase/phosphorylase [Hydrogenovibrio crunogenus]
MPSHLISDLKHYIVSAPLVPESITIGLPGFSIEISTNSPVLLKTLKAYFNPVLLPDPIKTPPSLKVAAYENHQFIDRGIQWQDWKREAGKSGRKDSFIDIEEKNETQRLIYKVKTGVLFWQKNDTPVAVGPVEQHPNQIINFILTQYLNENLRQGWLLGHAAGLEIQHKGIAIAGLSGGGKSTLMLHLLEDGEHFISNDRLLLNTQQTARPGQFWMRGIPKQPRINPGTIVYNKRLHKLISQERRQELLALPTEMLRELEEKYDADVNTLYHADCFKPETELNAFVILNWLSDSTDNAQLKHTTLNQSPKLLEAIIKSPGPFYSDSNNVFLANQTQPDPKEYLDRLGNIPCFELTGGIDFHKARDLVLEAIQTL